MRGHDPGLTLEGNQSLPSPFPVLVSCVLPTGPTEGAIFKDTALREQCVVETIWTEYGLKPINAFVYKFSRFWGFG